jgi:hypothetical protein
MIDNPKIKFSHRQRAAVVYIRQSHPSQMENHPESTARQYALSGSHGGAFWIYRITIYIESRTHGTRA